MIKKRTRKELYDKFRQGAIPSGADFADFIRSNLNLLEDGIDVSEDAEDPISLRAHGDSANLLDFADRDGNQTWRVTGQSSEGDKEGLNITSNDISKLFVERETGNIGINTETPAARVHIVQTNAEDSFRIDDGETAKSPLVVTAKGKVGIGLGIGDNRPLAKLHVFSETGGEDIFRIDDQDGDTSHFVINDDGNVGIGCNADQNNKLTVVGDVVIGDMNDLNNKCNLNVTGDITLKGKIKISSGPNDSIEVEGPIEASGSDFIIKDNVIILPSDKVPADSNSKGNLTVAGNTTLGSDTTKKHIINGSIESGGAGTEQQYDLVINDILTINRNPDISVDGNKKVTIDGNVEIKGKLIGGLPIGTILMYDGSGWVDNITLPGWKACIGAQNGTPDLRNRFIMGAESAGTVGGSNSITLTTSHLPLHSHSITGSISGSGNLSTNGAEASISSAATTVSGAHQHSLWFDWATANSTNCTEFFWHNYVRYEEWKTDSGQGDHSHTVNISQNNHAHGINDHSHGHSLTIGSSGSSSAFDIKPAYYSVIYIRRCS